MIKTLIDIEHSMVWNQPLIFFLLIIEQVIYEEGNIRTVGSMYSLEFFRLVKTSSHSAQALVAKTLVLTYVCLTCP